MKNKSVDIGVGVFLCLFSVLVFWYADQYTGRGVNRYGPDFFPKALSVMMFISAIILIIRAAVGSSLTTLESTNRQGFMRASGTLVLGVIYIGLMKLIGFYFATALFLYTVMAFLGQRGQVTRILVSFIVASLIFGIFHSFLKIPLPEGLIYNSFRSL